MENKTSFPYAHLTEKELKKIREAEQFLNSQPDHEHAHQEGKQVILLAYNVETERTPPNRT